ncbi:unnamed protein product [Discosporangium mesarthrocarpum]
MSGDDKAANIETAESAIKDAAATGAKIVILPECWNSPYDTTSFPAYAEPVSDPGQTPSTEGCPSTLMLSRTAKEQGVHVVGGSVPEITPSDGKIYNTCVVVGPDGSILAKHRKAHLFDICVPGKITFRESDTLSAGNAITTVETPFCTLGVGICYDIRFPELSMAMRTAGAQVLCFPGAFNMTTGPAHWELLQRARAVDNQCYVITVSPARNPSAKYQAWGHSSIVDPWGQVTATTDHQSDLVTAELDLERVEEVRRNIPVSTQKRTDLYRLVA